MVATIVSVASLWIFKPTVIEGLSEHSIDHALGERFAAHFAGWLGAKSPLCVCGFTNLRGAVEAGKHQIPHTANKQESLWIFDYVVLTTYFDGIVEVAHRCETGIPAFFNLGFESPLHVLAQIIHVFLRHAELDIHEDDIVIVAGVALGWRHHPDAVLLN